MNNFFLYLFESGVSLTLLYSIYWLFLKKDTYFNRNRVYLAVSILFSMIIPLINIPLTTGTGSITQIILLDEILITPDLGRSFTSILFTKSVSLLLVIYLLGVSFFSGILIFRLYQIRNLIKKGKSNTSGNIKIIRTQENISPFSFFNWVFLPEKFKDEFEDDKILHHEKVHVHQLHTIDLLFSELLIVFQWFNPIAWLYRFSFKEIHEYTADSLVLKTGTQLNSYQNLIMNQIFGIQFFPVGNNFNKSLIKNRIIMMTKNKSSILSNLKLLVIPPIMFALILVFSCTKKEESKTGMEQDNSIGQIKTIEANDNVTIEANDDAEVFFIVEEMPDFKGKGPDGFREYLGKNLNYPKIAAENGISGRVFVRFIVEEDGSVSNVTVVKGVDPALDAEAVRVIKNSPNWKPGKQRGQKVRVSFTFPINFALQ